MSFGIPVSPKTAEIQAFLSAGNDDVLSVKSVFSDDLMDLGDKRTCAVPDLASAFLKDLLFLRSNAVGTYQDKCAFRDLRCILHYGESAFFEAVDHHSIMNDVTKHDQWFA